MSEDTAQLLTDFRRYTELIEHALAAPLPFLPETESETAIQVERGIVLPRTVMSQPSDHEPVVGRLIEIAASGRAPQMAVVDRAGHHRPVYRPLLIYAWMQTFRLQYESLPRSEFGRWDEALRAWADLLESELGQISWPAAAIPATMGPVVSEAAWTALALHIASKLFVRDAWADLASYTFGRLTQNQQAGGVFLAPSPSDNPEPLAYHELSILHAAASYAGQAEDRHVASAVQRASEFHLNETQPDHASNQPWGLFAFIWNERTRPAADQMLHAAKLASPPDGVSLILLADALYCLRLFL